MNRREAEAIHEHLYGDMLHRLKASGVKIMTAEDRERLGVPDIRASLREAAIEALLSEDLSEQGRGIVNDLLAEKRKCDVLYEVRKALSCGCGSSRCGEWTEQATRAVKVLEAMDFS